MPLLPGTRLGAYEILGRLGSGAMGEVYRARDARLGRIVAIKVVPASLSADPERLLRFEKEAKAASILNHPNITIVYDVGTTKGTSWIAMELVEGKTLRSLLDYRPLATRSVLSLATQLAEGLGKAHAAGVVHGDLKPDNVMVTDEGRVKILDFGLAKLAREDGSTGSGLPPDKAATEAGAVWGTLSYMAPEQLKGLEADGRADIFSLGAILYEMLSGKHPFRGESSAETISAILRDEAAELPVLDQTFPPGLQALTLRCLEKRPERRFQSAQDLAFALMALPGISAPNASPSRSSRSLSPSSGLLVAIGLVAALAMVYVLVRNASRLAPPSFKMLTFRRGTVWNAMFAPDGQTVLYSAAWDGDPLRIFETRVGSPESLPLQLPDSELLSISQSGTLAIRLGELQASTGTLAEVPLGGGAPREIADEVRWATWAPDGRLAVARPVNERYRLEFPIGHVLYETSGFIRNPKFSPRGDRIAFEDHSIPLNSAGAVSVATLSGEVSRISHVWPGSLFGLAWSPSGDEVFYTASNGATGFGVFASTMSGKERLVSFLPGGAMLEDIIADGRALIVRFSDRSCMLFQGPNDKGPRDLYWLDSSRVEALSEDGRTVLFVEFGLAAEVAHGRSLAYLRTTDGSPPKRLGIGYPSDLSRDGKWAIVTPQEESPAQFVLLPTGTGEPRPLARDAINHIRARFLPDGIRIVFSGNEPGRGPRLYVQSLDHGLPRPISPEGVGAAEFAVSRDGLRVAAVGPDGRMAIYGVDGGPATTVPGARLGDAPISWSSDEASLFVVRWQHSGGKILRVDPRNGTVELVRDVTPTDPTGVIENMGARITPDGRSIAWGFMREDGELYLVDGLR